MLPFSKHEPSVAVVTGAGRGLGRELVLQLADKGLKVAALGRTQSDLEAVAQAAPDGSVLPFAVDVVNPTDLKQVFARIDQQLGEVDTLINNAAVYPHRDFLEETPESFMHTVDVNLGGVLHCSMLALERMVARGTGRIVNVATFAGARPTYLASAYSVSKGAARILTTAMAQDLGERFPDIVINDWIPGALNTAMGIPEGHDPQEAARWGTALALMHDPEINGKLFVEAAERLPEQSLKRRIFNKLTGQAPKPRRLV